MAQRLLDQSTAEEKIVYYSLAYSYVIYAFGLLYVVGSLIGWVLLAIYLLRIYVNNGDGKPTKPLSRISPLIWLWVVSMLVMELALLAGHIDRQLGMGSVIKSSIGWMKGWALLALFPLLGALIPINPKLLVRGVAICSASAIPFAILSLLVYFAGISGDVYFSPFKAIGGPLEVFQVRFFGMNPETGLPRWQFIGPWSPAGGLLSCFFIIIVWFEDDLKLRALAIAGALTMSILSQSRAGWVLIVTLLPIVIFVDRLKDPRVWVSLGVVIPIVVLLGEPIYTWIIESYEQIKQSRPGSTRVRNTLARIAIQRWQHEAPIWGHGVVERGPKVVEYMPIGTHHSWYGLLFVKGIVGLIALAVPLTLTFFYFLYLAQVNRYARGGFAIIFVMVAYSFFENLEILAYVYWPALMWLGFCLNPTNYQTEKG